MKRNNYLGLLLLVLFCSSCSSEVERVTVQYPEQQSEGFRLFTQHCSSCHRPPMPDVHQAQDWPGVVARMQQHKEQRGLMVMSLIQQQQVLVYLQKHAKKDK